jgi:hypothetical protein
MKGIEVRFPVGGDAWLYRRAEATARYRRGLSHGHGQAVVLGTGLSCVRDQWLDRLLGALAVAGYAAPAFDYRHFGDSGGEPRQAPAVTQTANPHADRITRTQARHASRPCPEQHTRHTATPRPKPGDCHGPEDRRRQLAVPGWPTRPARGRILAGATGRNG